MNNNELDQALESALQHLNHIDPWEIDDIAWQTRNRIRYRKLQALPMPIKLALIHGMISAVFFYGTPLPPDSPPLVIPLIWISSYCAALMVAAFVPRRTRRAQTQPVHWVHTAVPEK